MKKNKCAIVTINNSNYGNRLQNYAVQYILIQMGYEVTTIKNIGMLDKKKKLSNYILRTMASLIKKSDFVDTKQRELHFKDFNKNINFSKKMFNWLNIKWLDEFDFFIVGSDQVWNPDYRLTEFDLLDFTDKEKISFSASIGVKDLDINSKNKLKKALNTFKAISVRENEGKNLLETITEQPVSVLVDPTMLLTKEEWMAVEKNQITMKMKNIY